jgi:O-succinylbenzoic acid--CoA ligase
MYNLETNSEENQIILSPKLEELRKDIHSLLNDSGLFSHVALLSSGTTSKNPKGYAISKRALLIHATAVNQFLGLTTQDRWGLTLPPFHIGGLGIVVRSQLLNQKPVNLYPWNPLQMADVIRKEKITVISVVPTQIYDLVKHGIRAPKNLRIVLVGGDFLGDELERQARELGWPLWRTFGMTEISSQLATGGDLRQGLQILPIHQVKQDAFQRLWVKTPTLFTAEFHLNEGRKLTLAKEKFDEDEFYPLEDKVLIKGNRIIPLGRMDGAFKISGRLVSFLDLKNLLDRFSLEHGIWGEIELTLTPDPRLGQKLTLSHNPDINQDYIQKFLERISPIKVQDVESGIKRTELGKVQLREN